MNKKKSIVIIVTVIALITTFVLLATYAMWRIKGEQSKSNYVVGRCLNFRFIELDGQNGKIGGFTLEGDQAVPMSDEQGSATTGYTFELENTCSKPVNYQVVLESLKIPNEETENPDDYYPEAKYFDEDMIKIQFDSGTIKTYEDYDRVDDDTSAKYVREIRKTRELLVGTIPGKTDDPNDTSNIVSHNLKMWISIDSDNDDIGKIFRSKIKVFAGQGIENGSNSTSPTGGMSIVGDNCTINDIGCEVAIGDEHFYVLGTDENNSNNVKLLAKYNLLVGTKDVDIFSETISSYYTPNDVGYNLQSPAAASYSLTLYKLLDSSQNVITTYTPATKASVFASLTPEQKASISGVSFDNDDLQYLVTTATVPFYTPENDGNAYWYGDEYYVPKASYGSSYPTDVYNENSNVFQYVDAYQTALEDTYSITVEAARLITSTEILALGCTQSTCFTSDIINNNRTWIFDTSYWTGTAKNGGNMWQVLSFGIVYREGYKEELMSGVRPVIVVAKSIFD